MSRNRYPRMRTALAPVLAAVFVSWAALSRPAAQAAPPAPDLKAERTLAATISETRMVETVRRLVGFGTRMYGTPSNLSLIHI